MFDSHHRSDRTAGAAVWLSHWAPPVVYALAIFLFSSLSQPPSAPGALSDKHVHVLVFCGLALLLIRACSGGWPAALQAGPTLSAVALTVAYAVSDEWHQTFVPGRHAEVADLVADAAGAVLAVALAWAFCRVRRRAGSAPAVVTAAKEG